MHRIDAYHERASQAIDRVRLLLRSVADRAATLADKIFPAFEGAVRPKINAAVDNVNAKLDAAAAELQVALAEATAKVKTPVSAATKDADAAGKAARQAVDDVAKDIQQRLQQAHNALLDRLKDAKETVEKVVPKIGTDVDALLVKITEAVNDVKGKLLVAGDAATRIEAILTAGPGAIDKAKLTRDIDQAFTDLKHDVGIAPGAVSKGAVAALNKFLGFNASNQIGAPGNDPTPLSKAAAAALGDWLKDANLADEKVRESLQSFAAECERKSAMVATKTAEAIDYARGLQKDAKVVLGDVYQRGSQTLKTIRAFGDAPVTPGMIFNRKRLAYDFTQSLATIKMTPAGAMLARAGEGLKSLGLRLPTDELRDRLMPSFEHLDLGTLLPDVAGMRLDNLFEGVNINKALGEGVKVSHGLDEDTHRGWVKADVNLPVGDKTLLNWGPIRVDTNKTLVVANARVDVGIDGSLKHQKSGRVTADWSLTLGGLQLVTFVDTSLRFDDSGHIKFDISPNRVRMPGVLKFLTDMISAGKTQANAAGSAAGDALTVKDNGSGFSVRPIMHDFGGVNLPIGVESRLDLHIPDSQAGTSGYSNLNLGVAFGVLVDTTDGFDFRLRIGFNFAAKERPFTLSLFILGGAGYVSTLIEYSPMRRQLVARFDLAIYVSASLAVAFGPVTGGVYAYLGINASYSNGPNGAISLSAVFILRGDVSVAGLIDVSIVLTLELEYRISPSEGKFLLARGTLSLSIKICWCFTINVHVGVEYQFKTGEGSSTRTTAGIEAAPTPEATALLEQGKKAAQKKLDDAKTAVTDHIASLH